MAWGEYCVPCQVPAYRSSWPLCNFGNHDLSPSPIPFRDPHPVTMGEGDHTMQWELLSSVLDSR